MVRGCAMVCHYGADVFWPCGLCYFSRSSPPPESSKSSWFSLGTVLWKGVRGVFVDFVKSDASSLINSALEVFLTGVLFVLAVSEAGLILFIRFSL